MLNELSIEFVTISAIIFARLGSAFSQFPAISSSYIFVRARLFLALSTTIVLYPILQEYISKSFHFTEGTFLATLMVEILIGILIGMSVKIYFIALEIVGSIIAMQSGLSAATFFDPNHNHQVSITSSFLLLLAAAAIFASDTHYIFIQGVIDSYNIFQVGTLPDLADLSKFIAHTVNQSFIIAFKISAPFIAVSFGFLISNGVLSRLMPNLQVFFVVTPIQIYVIFCVLFIVVNSMMAKIIETLKMATTISM